MPGSEMVETPRSNDGHTIELHPAICASIALLLM